jgi:transketolase
VTNPGDDERILNLERVANRVRCHIVKTIHGVGGGHLGGPLSVTDILTVLYFSALKIDPVRPDWEDRDRFVLSKGHSCIALYSVLAERGYFPVSELGTYCRLDSRLQGHPDMTLTPGIDMSTGALGQGLSAAVGMALGAKLLGKGFKTYALIGDGECQEGQVWEAAFVASRYELDNLIVILDWNGLQQFGWPIPEKDHSVRRNPLDNPVAKWKAFGWRLAELYGHDMREIEKALMRAQKGKGKPAILIAHTTKGKGVSFMENDYLWHSGTLDDRQLARALSELQEDLE